LAEKGLHWGAMVTHMAKPPCENPNLIPLLPKNKLAQKEPGEITEQEDIPSWLRKPAGISLQPISTFRDPAADAPGWN
jgi:hypothetical protein